MSYISAVFCAKFFTYNRYSPCRVRHCIKPDPQARPSRGCLKRLACQTPPPHHHHRHFNYIFHQLTFVCDVCDHVLREVSREEEDPWPPASTRSERGSERRKKGVHLLLLRPLFFVFTSLFSIPFFLLFSFIDVLCVFLFYTPSVPSSVPFCVCVVSVPFFFYFRRLS